MNTGVIEKNNLIVQWATVIFGSLYGLTFSQWISLGVLVTGFITMLVNWYYKQKHLELELLKAKQTAKQTTKQTAKQTEEKTHDEN